VSPARAKAWWHCPTLATLGLGFTRRRSTGGHAIPWGAAPTAPSSVGSESASVVLNPRHSLPRAGHAFVMIRGQLTFEILSLRHHPGVLMGRLSRRHSWRRSESVCLRPPHCHRGGPNSTEGRPEPATTIDWSRPGFRRHRTQPGGAGTKWAFGGQTSAIESKGTLEKQLAQVADVPRVGSGRRAAQEVVCERCFLVSEVLEAPQRRLNAFAEEPGARSPEPRFSTGRPRFPPRNAQLPQERATGGWLQGQ